MRRRQSPRLVAATMAAGLLVAACGSGDPAGGDGGSAACEPGASGSAVPEASGDLAAAVASYDLAVGDGQRLLLGVLDRDAVQLAFGQVAIHLAHLGPEPGGTPGDFSDGFCADYLPVPGIGPASTGDTPRFLTGEAGTGVYQSYVDLPQPGWYLVRIVTEADDGVTRVAESRFPVLAEPEVHGVGDPAPRSVNHTIADVEAGDVPPSAVDSRALEADAAVPDPHIHDLTVAEAIESGRPSVVVVSTPTYCVSMFCGPLTETLAARAADWESIADVIHIEVWESFDERRLNAAAAEWIQTPTGGNEPWVFLVDGDGTIQARWDNVLDVDALDSALRAL